MEVHFFYRKNQSDPIEGLGTVYAIITIDNTGGKSYTCNVATPVRTRKKEFLEKLHEKELAKIKQLLHFLHAHLCVSLKREPTSEDVKNEYLRYKKPEKPQKVAKPSYPLLRTIFEKHIEKIECEESSKRMYNSLICSILKVLGENATTEDITESNIERLYQTYVKPQSNTHANDIICFFKGAMRTSRITNDTINYFKIEKARRKEFEFLEQHELNKLWDSRMQFYGLDRLCINFFMFLCETGLSLCDFQKLQKSDIITYKGCEYIAGKRQKTKKEYFVELSERAKTIGNEYQWSFKLPVNQARFRYKLLQALKALGINKHITPHKGRHTLAMKILDETGDKAYAAATLGNSLKMIEEHYAKLRISGYARIAEKYKK